MISPGTLRSYAAILRSPRTVVARTVDGRSTKCMISPGEIALAAAEALEFQADSIERANREAAGASLQPPMEGSIQQELTHQEASDAVGA